MPEFQTSDIKSRNYNYTVDYFELRAQPGRDGSDLPGGDAFWYRDAINGLLYPLYIDDDVVLGGTTMFGDEKLRVVGDVYIDGQLNFGPHYILNVGGELAFYDSSEDTTVTISQLLTSAWTRDAVDGWLRTTNGGDDVLIGLQSGSPARRLQMRSQYNNGTSYLIHGVDSGDVEIFTVDDQGFVTAITYAFAPTTYINYSSGFNFYDAGTRVATFGSTASFGPDDSWRLNNAGAIYAFGIDIDTGFGITQPSVPAIYIDGSPAFYFASAQFTMPQNAWIYSGRQVIRVNTSDQIEVGNFILDDLNKTIFWDANSYLQVDEAGVMWFHDDITGSISLAELAAQANVYWNRDNVSSVVYPVGAADTVRIPKYAGGGTQIAFIDNLGDLVVGSISDNAFEEDITVTLSGGKTFGKYSNGQTIPATGLTAADVIRLAAIEYIDAYFNYFAVNQATTVEVGTTLSGVRIFSWGIDEGSGNVFDVSIYDITNTVYLGTGLANDGTETLTLTSYQLNSEGATQSWRGEALDTNTDPDTSFNSSSYTVTARYYRFYGPASATPTNDTEARALPTTDWQTGTDNFTLNTGTTLTKFVVALPPGVTISQVIDLDALQANITTEYIDIGPITIVDAGGTNRSYNLYEMNISEPYSENHRHQITAG